MGNTVARDDDCDVPVLFCSEGCVHKVSWISPRSKSFTKLLDYERRHSRNKLTASPSLSDSDSDNSKKEKAARRQQAQQQAETITAQQSALPPPSPSPPHMPGFGSASASAGSGGSPSGSASGALTGSGDRGGAELLAVRDREWERNRELMMYQKGSEGKLAGDGLAMGQRHHSGTRLTPGMTRGSASTGGSNVSLVGIGTPRPRGPHNRSPDGSHHGSDGGDNWAVESEGQESDMWGWYDEGGGSTSEGEGAFGDIRGGTREHVGQPVVLRGNQGGFDEVRAPPPGRYLGPMSPPEYILEESLSTQALWHSTAGRRPQQPEEEREEIEKMYEQNFAKSAMTLEAISDDDNPNKKQCCRPSLDDPVRVIHRGKSPFGHQVTKSFQCPHCANMSAMMVHIPKFQIVERNGDVHAEYLVVVGLGHVTFGVWRRFSQFQRLAEKIINSGNKDDEEDQYRMSKFSWQCLRRRKRLFRCLDKDYLALKCFLLERFLHDLLFECDSPSVITDALGVAIDTAGRW